MSAVREGRARPGDFEFLRAAPMGERECLQ